MQHAKQILVGKSFPHLSQKKVPEIWPCSELSRATQGSNSYWIFIAEKVCQPASLPAIQSWLGKYKQALFKIEENSVNCNATNAHFYGIRP